MKVTVNQQVITRPEVFKTNKPGFHNFGKDVKINTRGQLVTQSAGAAQIKKAFGFEDAFKDIGFQNIGKKTEIELQNTGQIDKKLAFRNIGQRDEKESKFGFQNIIQNTEGKGNKFVTPPGLSVSQNAKGNKSVNPTGLSVSQNAKGNKSVNPLAQLGSQNNGQKGRSIDTLA